MYLGCGCIDLPVVANDDKIGALAEQPDQRFAEETILHHQEYADAGAGDKVTHGSHYFLGCAR
jgi:hypothetical protein